MALAFVRGSRILRAFVLTTWIASLMAWAYITLRIIVNQINPPLPLLPDVPWLSFLLAGLVSFVLFCGSMFLYLWIWGRFRDMPGSVPRPPEWRR